MNQIEKLLKLDTNKIQLPTKEIEVSRLSAVMGEKFILKLQGVSTPEGDAIREMAIKEDSVDVREMRNGFILAGVKEPNLRDESLRKHFGVGTPYDLVDKLFLPGERDTLYEEINKLSGYNEGAIQEVKNS